MKRAALLLIVMSVPGWIGCSSCCTPWDDAYPTYGGKWERVDRFHGRVGSAFNDASGQLVGDGEVVYTEEGEWTEPEAVEGEMIEGDVIE